MTPSDTLSWYIVQFKPNSHKIAVRNLQRQGFETFLPMHEVTRRTVVKFETVIRPLFAGYMFVACDPEKAPWRQINSTYGVSPRAQLCRGPQAHARGADNRFARAVRQCRQGGASGEL